VVVVVIDSVQMLRGFAFLAQAVVQADQDLEGDPCRLR
jgi:hypothetical protein